MFSPPLDKWRESIGYLKPPCRAWKLSGREVQGCNGPPPPSSSKTSYVLKSSLLLVRACLPQQRRPLLQGAAFARTSALVTRVVCRRACLLPLLFRRPRLRRACTTHLHPPIMQMQVMSHLRRRARVVGGGMCRLAARSGLT